MSEQLKLDLEKLHDLSISLARLRGELSVTPDHLNQYSASMGNQPLAAATQSLGDDWNYFRADLIDDMSTLGTFAETAIKTYKGMDADLAKQIHQLLDPPVQHGRVLLD